MNDSSNGQKSLGTQPTSTQALVDDAKNVASNLASEAKDVVGKLAGGAKDKLEETVSTGKDSAAEKIGDVAGALRHTAEAFDEGPLPAIADRAAGELERVADYVQSRTIGELLHDVETFARREPALFLGGSFVLGLIGGRFLKSSGSRVPAARDASEPEARRSRGAIPRDGNDERGRGNEPRRSGGATFAGAPDPERNGEPSGARTGKRADNGKAAPGANERAQRP
jgi:hypothetical protein